MSNIFGIMKEEYNRLREAESVYLKSVEKAVEVLNIVKRRRKSQEFLKKVRRDLKQKPRRDTLFYHMLSPNKVS
jgi:hypothetical protein